MQVSHSFAVASAVFDDEHLVSYAGLVPVMTLAEQTGLSGLLGEKVHIAEPRIKSGAANPSPKLVTVVAGMCVGADCIDDIDAVRSGGMTTLFDGVYAPSTVGTLLREFTFGHARQLESVLREHLVALCERVHLLPGGVTPVDTSLAPAPVHLGALGIGGLTAYFGLLDIGRPEPGQTVVISGAAGSVGSVAGQIARIKGCRAIGIAGGQEKCRWLVEELGFDAAIDYKAGDLRAQLKAHAPNGVDVFFDNVGGEALEAALAGLARGGRVVLCGAVSQYNATAAGRGPANYMQLLVARGVDDGFRDLRPCRPLRRRGCPAGEVAAQRRAALTRARRGRRRQRLPGDPARALPWREYRQAGSRTRT